MAQWHFSVHIFSFVFSAGLSSLAAMWLRENFKGQPIKCTDYAENYVMTHISHRKWHHTGLVKNVLWIRACSSTMRCALATIIYCKSIVWLEHCKHRWSDNICYNEGRVEKTNDCVADPQSSGWPEDKLTADWYNSFSWDTVTLEIS